MKLLPPDPVALFLGPIFQKEVRVLGRRRGTYIARSIVALGMAGILSMFFLTYLNDTPSMGIHRLQSLQALAPMLTLVVIWFQFISLGLLAPMLTADGISEERRAQTLSALLTTPLTASQIVFGKLSSRLVQILILASLSLPLLLSIRVFGGLSAQTLLAATAMILSTAVLGAALGLMFSLWNRIDGRASTAAMQAVVILLVLQFGPYVGDSLRVHLFQRLSLPASPLPNIDATSTPFVMTELSFSSMMGTELRTVDITLWPTDLVIPLGPAWVANSIYNIGLALLVAWVTSIVLRRTMRRLANEAPRAASARWRLFGRSAITPAAVAAGPEAAPAATAEASEIARAASRTVTGNPVLWRELRQPALGSRRRLLLAAVGAGLAFGLLYWSVDIAKDHGIHGLIAFLGALVMLVQAAYSTSGTIAGERDGRTWDALLATPLTGSQIVLAKFAGALRGQWFFLSIVMVHFVVAAVAEAVRPLLILQIAMIIVGPLVLLTATGQFLALAFRRGITAAAANLLLALALFAGIWIAIGSIALLLRGDEPVWFKRLVDCCYATHPFTLLAATMERASVDRSSGYDLIYSELSPRQFGVLLVAVFAGYLALAAGVLALTCRAFRRLTGRAS